MGFEFVSAILVKSSPRSVYAAKPQCKVLPKMQTSFTLNYGESDFRLLIAFFYAKTEETTRHRSTDHPGKTLWPGCRGSALAVAVCNAGMGWAHCRAPCSVRMPCVVNSRGHKVANQPALQCELLLPCSTKARSCVREAEWRKILAPYYREFGIDPESISSGPGRAPFSHEAADVLSEFRPPVVSFHFGLPSPELLARLQAWDPVHPFLRNNSQRSALA